MDIEAANREAIARFLGAEPFLEDVRPAIEVVPGMQPDLILHAGPPLAWDNMSALTQGAIIGSALYEGLAQDPAEVPGAIRNGRIRLGANHEHCSVGPMAGPISASRAVWVVRNRQGGNFGYSPVHEGMGKVIAYGAHSAEIIERQRWVGKVLQPIISQAIRHLGGIDVRAHIAESLLRGDELHSRNKAATSMLLERLAVPLLDSAFPRKDVVDATAYLSDNNMSFCTVAMAAAKATTDAAAEIEGSTLVTAYARNGATVGIRVSGTGDRWFIAPAPRIKAHYFPGFSEADACPDIGDSTIVECAGLGAFAVAASPTIAQLQGRTVREVIETTLHMYEITMAEHPIYRIPFLDFRGAPVGIDVRKVIRTGILPIGNTSTAHREAGRGIIGAGLVQMPMECFRQALVALSGQS